MTLILSATQGELGAHSAPRAAELPATVLEHGGTAMLAGEVTQCPLFRVGQRVECR